MQLLKFEQPSSYDEMLRRIGVFALLLPEPVIREVRRAGFEACTVRDRNARVRACQPMSERAHKGGRS